MRGDTQKGWSLYRHRDFTGGENKTILPEKVQPNQVLKALNCTFTGDGILETRQGKVKINTAALAGPIISVHRYVKEDGTGYILVQSGTTLYAKAWNGNATLADLTTTAVTKTVNAAKLRSVTWRNVLILTNGSDNPFSFDGSAFTDLAGTPPKSKIIKVYASKLWLVDVANPNHLRFSGLEDYGAWDALDVIKINSQSGDTITGLAAQPGGLVIFKLNETWTLYGFDRFDMRLTTAPINASVGAVNPDVVIDGGFVYGGDNVYQFTLDAVTPLSDTHRALFADVTLANQKTYFATMTPESGRIIMYAGSECMNIETRYGGILSWDTLNASCFATLNGKDDDGTLLIGDATDGYIYRLGNQVDDAGVAITTEIWDCYRDYDQIRNKVWRRYDAEVETFNAPSSWVFFSYDIDYGKTSGSTSSFGLGSGDALIWDSGRWGVNLWASGGFMFNPAFHFVARGNRASFRIKALERVRYLGYNIKFREAGYL